MALIKQQTNNMDSHLCKLTINEDMTIYTIATIKDDISREISDYESVELNLAAVEEIDSAGIQFLLALKYELEQNKKPFQLTGISHCVEKLMRCYGVSHYFSTVGTA